MKKVFLGGTCNNSKWREKLIPLLDFDYFNPVVDNWNEDALLKEEEEKEICNIHLYCITPLMTCVYSIAEVVESAIINEGTDKTTVFCLLQTDYGAGKNFSASQLYSFDAVIKLLKRYNAKTLILRSELSITDLSTILTLATVTRI